MKTSKDQSNFHFGNLDARDTRRVMLAGLVTAIAICLPFYSWIFARHWEWAENFPLGWLGIGLTYMATFFHEIGHTLMSWFYGYPTLPGFDFKHGGGMAWSLGKQQYLIIGILYLFVAYGLYEWRERRILQAILLTLLAFHILTAYIPLHRSVIDFMGPAFEPLIAAFFLYRALFDRAPRGWFERFLNALFGFALIFRVMIDSYGLLNSQAYRLVYYQQKGAHGFGDFDKIAQRLGFLNFETIVLLWAGLALMCLIVPYSFYGFRPR